MELKVRLRLNPITELEAVFAGDDFQDIVRAAGVMLDFDGKCGFCSSDNITLTTRTSKDRNYKFTEYVCKACNARRPLGQYKDGRGFFLKPWEEAYKGDGGAE